MIALCAATPPPPPPGRSPLSARARELRDAFDTLWPVILAVVGLALLLGFALVPSLRNPGLIASVTGLFSVVSVVGAARREPR